MSSEPAPPPARRGHLFVVSAPSGTGKTTVVERLVQLETARRQKLQEVEELNRQANETQKRIGPAKDPAERERLTWVAESAPIPEGGIAARDGLDPAIVAKVRAALLQMRGPAYADLLKRLYDIDGFEPAEDREYDVIRQAMDMVGLRPR